MDKGNKTCIILGNGESRIGVDYRKEYPDAFVYGCNGAYREEPDALICTDVYMQHLIYKSGYCKEHLCYFSEWDPIPEEVVDAYLKETFGQVIQNEKQQRMQLYQVMKSLLILLGLKIKTWLSQCQKYK